MVVVADGTAFFWLDGKSKISFFFLVLQISFSGTAARASEALRHICTSLRSFSCHSSCECQWGPFVHVLVPLFLTTGILLIHCLNFRM